MDENAGSLLTIGGFASAAQLSIKALRLYEHYAFCCQPGSIAKPATATTRQRSFAWPG
jgi:hypothetical protein